MSNPIVHDELIAYYPTVGKARTNQGYMMFSTFRAIVTCAVSMESNMSGNDRPDSIESYRGVEYLLIRYLSIICPDRRFLYSTAYNVGNQETYRIHLATEDNDDEDRVYIYTCKPTVIIPKPKSGRSLKEQIELEINSISNKRYQDPKNTIYSPDGEYLDSPFRTIDDDRYAPMYALDYTTRMDNITYPIYVQQKYDGIRALLSVSTTNKPNMHHIDDNMYITFTSRRGNDITYPILYYCKEDLLDLPRGDYTLDGELYSSRVSNGVLNGIIHSVVHNDPTLELIKYYVFDILYLDMPYNERLNALIDEYKSNDFIRISKTYLCNNRRELEAELNIAKDNEWEGLICRNPEGLYMPGSRNALLIKIKTYYTEVYTIVDVEEASGKETGLGLFVVRHNNQDVRIRPALSEAERADILKYTHKYVGLNISVKYYGLMEKGGLRHPTMIAYA